MDGSLHSRGNSDGSPDTNSNPLSSSCFRCKATTKKITKTKNSPKVDKRMKMIHKEISTYYKRGSRGGIEEQNIESCIENKSPDGRDSSN